MDRAQLEQRFKQHGIRRVKVGGFDIDGVLRGKYISCEKFWSAIEKGFGFCDVIFGWDLEDQLYDRAKLTGWHTGYPDLHSRIDTDTFRVLPCEPHTAHFLIDFWSDPDTPYPACPRNLLAGVTRRARDAGYSPFIGVELEYWIFKEDPASLRDKGFKNLTPLSPGMFGYSWVRTGQNAEFVEDVLEQLEGFDIDIESFHTETGPGVYEAAIRYADPVRAADMAALFKSVMKVLCARHGYAVTFMAKWSAELPGSSGHIHQSLWNADGSETLFSDTTADDGLSPLARNYIGGLVALSPELTALFSPTINSYKRYVPGMWAPMTAAWGVDNRTCSIRAIRAPSASSTRVEFRQPAADINPYIAIAACLGAGLHGVAEKIEPPAPTTGDATEDKSAPALPTTLTDAVRALSESTLARKILPAAFVDHYVITREWELRQYARSVTDWELARYFETV